MLVDIALLLLGLLLVGQGGQLFVNASLDIARCFRIPRIVIGSTLVSLATTVPEAIVSLTASAMGDSELAIGNAVGSTIANIGLIIATVALIKRVTVEPDAFNSRARWMLAATVLLIALSWSLAMSRGVGLILLSVAVAYLVSDLVRIVHQSRETNDRSATNEGTTSAKMAGAFLLGAALVLMGSRLLVESGVAIASVLGVPSAVVGLSVIALGTSLPELVTGVVAARKGVPDLALGNILGANVLNLALISGLAAIINPVTLGAFTRNYAFPWLLIFVVLIITMLRKDGTLLFREGAILLGAYVLYLCGLVVIPLLG